MRAGPNRRQRGAAQQPHRRDQRESSVKVAIIGAVAVVIAALVAVAGPGVFNALKDSLGDKREVTVQFAVGVENDASNRSPFAFAIPDKELINLPVPSEVAPYTCSGVSREWVRDQGGYQVGDTWGLLTVFARNTRIVINNFDVVTTSVKHPGQALVIKNGCGGDMQEPYLEADLDTSHITYSPPSGTEEQQRAAMEARRPFGRNLAAGDSYSIPFVARAKNGVYTWKIRANLLIDGVPSEIIADTGTPGWRTGGPPITPTYILLDSEMKRWVVKEP